MLRNHSAWALRRRVALLRPFLFHRFTALGSTLTGLPHCFGVVFLAVGMSLGLMAAPSSVHASTLSYSSSFSGATDWSEDLPVQEFNPSNGTLTSVTLDLTGSLSTALLVGNISGSFSLPASPSSGSASTESMLAVSSGSLNLGLSPLDLVATAPFSGLSPGSITPSMPESQTSSNSYTYTTSALLQDFTGLGTFSLAASTSTLTSITYSGGVSYAYAADPNASLTETVTYNYTPVPEPSTLALLVVGLIGLVRRKQSP